jgi:hypothetical protein
MRVKFDPPREYWIKKYRKDNATRKDFYEYCETLYSRLEKKTTSDAKASTGDNH